MIVYVGLVPVIADSLPPTVRVITIIDGVIYCQLVINVLCLSRGYTIRNYDSVQFDNYKLFEDPLFLISFVVAIASGLVLVFLLFYYCVCKAFYYNMEESDVDESERKTQQWVSPHMFSEGRSQKALFDSLNKKGKGDDKDKEEGKGKNKL